MAYQFFVHVLLSLASCAIFSTVESQYAATTVPPMTCDSRGNCVLQCPLPPTCVNAIAPCSVTTCPNFPNAQCATSCPGCFAVFYVNGKDVTDQCRGAVTVIPPTFSCPVVSCAPGVPTVNCLVAPCSVTTCPRNPYVKCCDNYCGGCNAFFYDNGVNVTSSC